MKGHKGYHHRKGRATGGVAEYKEDISDAPEARDNARKIEGAAKELKRGGMAKKMGKVEGMAGLKHAGRKARKSGGRTGSNFNPMSSAASGTPAKGRSVG